MTAAERREKARLRSERWRRAHGIMPRRPAQRPWLVEGISRSNMGIGDAPKPVSKPPWRLRLREAKRCSTARKPWRLHWRATSNDARRFRRSSRESLPLRILKHDSADFDVP
jgi:hypothetical protein